MLYTKLGNTTYVSINESGRTQVYSAFDIDGNQWITSGSTSYDLLKSDGQHLIGTGRGIVEWINPSQRRIVATLRLEFPVRYIFFEDEHTYLVGDGKVWLVKDMRVIKEMDIAPYEDVTQSLSERALIFREIDKDQSYAVSVVDGSYSTTAKSEG